MIIPVLKFSYRSIVICIEIMLGILILFLALMCFGFWKLSEGPVNITFMADTVKKAIVSPDHKTDLQFDSIVAEWPEFGGPISIGMSGVKLFENNKPVMNIPQLGIRIAKAPLFIGQIKPEVVITKNATIKLYRAKNGGVHLFVNDQNKIADETVITEDGGHIEMGFKEIGEALFKGGNLPDYHQIEPLSKIERFSVENAHIIIVDDETGKGWNIPELDFEVLRKENQFTMVANYQEGTNPATTFSFLLERDASNQNIRFYSDIDKINISTLGRLLLPLSQAHGPQFIVGSKVEGILDSSWTIQKLDGHILSEKGNFTLDGLYETPLEFSKLSGKVSYDKATQKIILYDSHVNLNNRTIELSGEKLANSRDNIFPLQVRIPSITFDEIHALWPDKWQDSVAAVWLTRRLGDATIRNLSVSIPIDILNPANIDSTKLDASLTYEGLTADYQAPLFPVTKAKGRATLKDDILSISIDSGQLDSMIVQKASIVVPHLTHPTKVGLVEIEADITGAISSALNYISLEPIGLGKEIGLNPDQAKGTAVLKGKVSFPALKDLPKEQVTVIIAGTLNDTVLPNIVRGMDLTGGPYDLKVNAGAVTITGKGALGGQPIDLDYTEFINRSSVPFPTLIKASIITDKKLRETFGVHLDQFVDGNVPVTIDYKQATNSNEEIGVTANLTPAVVKFSPFKYIKPVGKSGQMSGTVFIQKGEVKKISDLKISIDKEGSATGAITFGRVGKINDIKSGRLGTFTLAGANNFALGFTQTSPDVFDVTIIGKQLDGRPFLGNKKNEGRGSGDVSYTTTRVNAKVDVAQIKTGDKTGQMLLSPNLSLKTNAKGDVTFLDLKGKFNGGSLSVSIQPNASGKSELRITSDNAGGALKVMDIYDTMIGGTMDIRGTQIIGGGVNDITGRGTIGNFTVVKAPFLAKLINLFSISGLTELLQDKGIEFKSLKTDFEWKNTKSGRVVSLKNGRTTGASIGLTFGGNIYQDKGTIDLSGTFVPMSEINGFFSKIPVLGNILTGGKNGGIIAATYSMKGKTDNPTVMLNPLSVLTPGFLRSIFFEKDKNIFDDNSDDAVKTPPSQKKYNN